MSNYVEKSNIISALQRFHENDMNLFATKDEVQASVNAEASARETADRILDARVTNLEQTTKQQEVTVSYPDDGTYSSIMPDGIPASAAKYAEVPTINGKTRAWNQLVEQTFTTSTYRKVRCSVSKNDDIYTVSLSSGTSMIINSLYDSPVVLNGHKYLFVVEALDKSHITGDFKVSFVNQNQSTYDEYYANPKIMTASADFYGFGLYANNLSAGDYYTFKHFLVRDLTVIFGAGNEPTTAADALKALPDLAKRDAFNAGSLVDTTVTGVEAIGFNIWDEQYYGGGYILDNGSIATSGYGARIASKNYIPVDPLKSYYIYVGSYQISSNAIRLAWYDANYNFIKITTQYNATVTPPTNARYMRFNTNLQYGSATYNHDICINRTQPNTSISPHNGDYLPYERKTLMLSAPFTGKSAGSVKEVLDIRTGKKTRPVGSVDLGTLVWTATGGDGKTSTTNSGINYRMSNNTSMICGKYIIDGVGNQSAGYYGADKTIRYFYLRPDTTAREIYLHDSSLANLTAEEVAQALSGVMLYFELAAPLEDEQVCDPIPDNYLEVQGGGTTRTIQSQSPVIDNCLDVTYDLIPSA